MLLLSSSPPLGNQLWLRLRLRLTLSLSPVHPGAETGPDGTVPSTVLYNPPPRPPYRPVLELGSRVGRQVGRAAPQSANQRGFSFQPQISVIRTEPLTVI
jgi:hypothetical protein